MDWRARRDLRGADADTKGCTVLRDYRCLLCSELLCRGRRCADVANAGTLTKRVGHGRIHRPRDFHREGGTECE
jgi:hypothetical protein